ncbi:MAG: hypothetical protein Q9M27_02285, partial [Mariprofundaceae bacterium]|nr:hypothetical protein [Mariprofundaceae bacterium]
HSWATYRWGDMEEIASLERVNLAHARQAIITIPDHQGAADTLAHATFSLIAIRKVNPNIYLNYATPGMAHPHLDSHHHMLQIGWDTQAFYNKPTVIHSQPDVRANMFRNILVYRDFDQVLERLMIPERTEESALQVCEWGGLLKSVDGMIHLCLTDSTQSMPVTTLAARLMMRGVTLVAMADESGRVHPLYKLDGLQLPQKIPSLLGIAINAHALNAEVLFTIKRLSHLALPETLPAIEGIEPVRQGKTLKLLITGWVGSLPLLLQRLLAEFEQIHVTLIDDLSKDELIDELAYLRRRFNATPGANDRISADIIAWNFSDMNFLRPYVEGVDKILLSRPRRMQSHAYASITTVLSHLVTIVREHGGTPDIFPILENRTQALLLQQELERFKFPLEIHVTVPDAFYGTYLAHTSFHMYASENEGSYELQRTLRHTIDGLMGDVGDEDMMDVFALNVTQALPEDAEALAAQLLQNGYIW